MKALMRAAVGVVAFAGWAQAADGAAPPVEIEIGNLAAPVSAVAWLEKEIEAFSESHPGIEVQALSFTEPHRKKLPLTMNPPLPRNVMGVGSQFGYEAAWLALNNRIVPIEQFLPDPDFSLDIFYDSYWDGVTFEGKHWGVPWAAFTDVLVCDARLFEAAGIDGPPKSWDELLDVAKQLTLDTDGDGAIDQWGLRVRINEDTLPDVVMSMIAQKGATLMRGGRFDLSDPAVKDCCAFVQELLFKSGAVKVERRQLAEALADPSVKFAMYLCPSKYIEPLIARPDLLIAPMPTFGPAVTHCPSRLYLCILRSTPEEERASWELVKWMCRPGISIPDVYQGYPCRKDLVHRADFTALAAKYAKGYETLLTATEFGVDLPEQVIGRIDGARDLFKTLAPALMGLQPFDALAPRAVDAANAKLVPLPVSTGDLAFYK